MSLVDLIVVLHFDLKNSLRASPLKIRSGTSMKHIFIYFSFFLLVKKTFHIRFPLKQFTVTKFVSHSKVNSAERTYLACNCFLS